MDQTANSVQTVEITPDYNNLFQMFIRDFSLNAQNLQNLDLDSHSLVHSILASLNVAVQAVDSTANFGAMREELAVIVESSSNWLRTKQEAADEMDGCTCDYPSTLGGHHSYCELFEGYENKEF